MACASVSAVICWIREVVPTKFSLTSGITVGRRMVRFRTCTKLTMIKESSQYASHQRPDLESVIIIFLALLSAYFRNQHAIFVSSIPLRLYS